MIWVDNRNHTNPYFNLALEEYLVRHADCGKDDYVLFYINEPSIILGKNQSIYKEVNFEFLRNGALKLARRITGGGTVYHDPGNLSFSFISRFADEKVNNYRYFNQPIVNALQKIGLAAEMDARNNILLNGKKISGSAQFTDRKNIISHGTLLFDADLVTLRSCLKENDFKVETKAVGSVRSSVMNFSEASGRFETVEELKNYLMKELKVSSTWQLSEAELKTTQQMAEEKMKSYEWIYGRSPHTTLYKEGLEIEIEQGIIQSVNGENIAGLNLTETKYAYSDVKTALADYPNGPEMLKRIF